MTGSPIPDDGRDCPAVRDRPVLSFEHQEARSVK